MGYGLSKDSPETKAAARTVLLASGDAHFRERLRRQLTAMRWTVREASGGAEAMARLEEQSAEAMVLDSILPDLEVKEFARQMRAQHPVMDLLWVDACGEETTARSPRRNELLHALRHAQEETLGGGRPTSDTAAWTAAPVAVPQDAARRIAPSGERALISREVTKFLRERASQNGKPATQEEAITVPGHLSGRPSTGPRTQPLPEMVGDSPGLAELARMVRLVAPRAATVLIQGETGTGKELVARAVRMLSVRAGKSFLVLNCAAIPEALLEAELFGHTRGAG